MSEPSCLVLPLDGHRQPRPDDNPWELMARGEGIMVQRSDAPAVERATWRAPSARRAR